MEIKSKLIKKVHVLGGLIGLLLVSSASSTVLLAQPSIDNRTAGSVEIHKMSINLQAETDESESSGEKTGDKEEPDDRKHKKRDVAGATQSQPPDIGPAPDNSFVSRSLNFINTERSRLGRTAFKADSVLTRYAQAQAQLMAESCRINHQDLEPILGQKSANGKTITAVAENVAFHSSNFAPILDNLWDSPDHQDNMTNNKYNRVGVAVVVSENLNCKGYIYTSQVFGKAG